MSINTTLLEISCRGSTLFENKKRFIFHNFRTITVSLISALGGTADVESIQAMMEEEDQKEKGFLEVLGKKMKDEGVS